MQKCSIDKKPEVVVPGNKEDTLNYCVDHFLKLGNEAIKDHGYFAVALSGGSTPKEIFQRLSSRKHQLDWSLVRLFWGDERSVPPKDKESNYLMAFSSGLENLGIPEKNIFRMKAESSIEENAKAYEELIKKNTHKGRFDLVMLGMGDDGHTASLFSGSLGLHVTDRLVIANFVPQKNTWRMTLTYSCINAASNICFYIIGAGKASMLQAVLSYPLGSYPCQGVKNALWICDRSAAEAFAPAQTPVFK